MDFGQKMREKRNQEKREAKMNDRTWTPPGFDISLADAISELDMNHDQIRLVGELTAKRQIANAKVGRNVFYRRAALERLMADAK